MKKFGTIITLAVALVIGGVYATFHYAQESPVVKEKAFLATVVDTADTSNYGAINIDSNNLQLKTTKKNSSEYITVGTFSGKLSATFTPGENAPDNIKQYGILWGMRLDIIGNAVYSGNAIFTQSAYSDGKDYYLMSNNPNTVTDRKNFRLIASTLNKKQVLKVNEIELSSKEAFEAYKAVLSSITIKITLLQYIA